MKKERKLCIFIQRNEESSTSWIQETHYVGDEALLEEYKKELLTKAIKELIHK